MMIQVGSAGRLRNPDVSCFRSKQKAADGSFESGFAALLEKKNVRLSEQRNNREEPAVTVQREPESGEGCETEEKQPETGDFQAAAPWLLQESLAAQIQSLQFLDPCLNEGADGVLRPTALGAVLPNQPEAAPGADGEREFLESPGILEGLSEAVDGAWKIQSDSVHAPGHGILARREVQMQDGFASQEPEEGSALHLIAESGENRLFPAEEGSEETETDHENGQEIRKVSGQGHQKETAEAGSHPGIEARGGQMLRTEPEISSGVGSSRPYHHDPVRMPTSEHALIRDTAEMLVSRAPLKEGVLELELEPVSLGKLTIRVAFESGRTAVTVLSSSSETLEILSKNASQIAQILEERTGEQTVVYTPQTSDPGSEPAPEQHGGRGNSENEREHKKEQGESFAQQLRLGLVQG